MRLQLALNVTDLDAAIDFYSKMFDTPPAKVRDGYANFAIDEPAAQARAVRRRRPRRVDQPPRRRGRQRRRGRPPPSAASRAVGLDTTGIDETICCYAEKAETWVHAPDGNRWEWYVKTADAEQIEKVVIGGPADPSTSCCPA